MTGSKCDSHIHLFRDGFAGKAGTSPAGDDERAEYEHLRLRHDIDLALVVGYTGEPRYRSNNHDILALAKDATWLRPLAYLANTDDVGVSSLLDAGFYGVAVYATEPSASAEPVLRAALPVLAERSAVLSINVVPARYDEVARALDTRPDATVLISHLGLVGVGATEAADVRAALTRLCRFAELPGVHVKASGSYALPTGVGSLPATEIVEELIDAFGTSRVLWGSDYPVVLDYTSFETIVNPDWLGALATDARSRIEGDNLRQLLNAVSR